MTTQQLPTLKRVKAAEFGGRTVEFEDGMKLYSVIVVGSCVSATCYYPMAGRANGGVSIASRELRNGPLLAKLTDAARKAIDKAKPPLLTPSKENQ